MENHSHVHSPSEDKISQKIRSITGNVLVITLGLLPLFFIPLVSAPIGYSKVLVALVGVVLSLILFSLLTLRLGAISFRVSYAIGGLWLVFGVALLSTLLSGDFRDSFVGDVFSVQSTAFLGLMALTATVWPLVNAGKVTVMRLYMVIAGSTLVLALFHVLRLIFGADFLSFGFFAGNTATPLGGWNDLALFLGLVILLSLVALEQLPLTKWGRVLFGVVSAAALIMLAIINFFYVWAVLSIISLVMLVYTVKRPQIGSVQEPLIGGHKGSAASSLVLSLVVFVVSVFFMVGGAGIGTFLNNLTGISYIEVRPSFEATVDIARGVYQENAFLGTGANKFVDAWRAHKDLSINATIFWNTDFNAGSGYIPTFFVTTGVLGGVAWVIFFALLLVLGFKTLLSTQSTDRMWFFIGVSSFVSAVYIWGMAVIYVPGPAVLLIGAFSTGITALAYNNLSSRKARTISVGNDRRIGFVLTLAVVAIIVGSVGTLYVTAQHFSSIYIFNESVGSIQAGTPLETVEQEVVRAYELSASDVYARRIAEYQFARMNTLLGLQSPTEAQQQQFRDAIANGINAGQLATEGDPEEPSNWAVLGSIYGLLLSAGVEGSYERGLEALTRAKDLDSRNPGRYLALAQLEARNGNLEGAKQLAEEAVSLKQNYSDAFFFLTQLAIAAGNVEDALASARTVITLEPGNPARYYQLGVLESSAGNVESAVAAFERAVQLDQNYANARYFLALGYDALGRSEEAKAQLERVLELNPGNENVIALLNQLKTQGSLSVPETPAQPVEGEEQVTEEDGVVTTNEDPDTPLVTPVNIPPEEEESEPEPDQAE